MTGFLPISVGALARVRDIARCKVPPRGERGISLVELIVAVTILSVGILGFIGAFRYITQSVHISRLRTIATNLAQEKEENLKNLSYYQLLITTVSATDASFSPALVYDTLNYPPETITIGGVKYTRYTFVSLAQVDNNVISTVTYTYPDTGMKQITVNVVWTQNNQKKRWTLNNLLENPNVAPLDSSFSGTVRDTSGAGISGVSVQVVENPDWNDVTAAGGTYSFRVYHGSYTIRASSTGYWDRSTGLVAASVGSNTTQDFTLTKIGTGTIAGNAWINPYLQISQVVVQTTTWSADFGGPGSRNVEYIELFNPTTRAINIGPTWCQSPCIPDIEITYASETSGSDHTNPDDFHFVHITTYVAPNHNYLIASSSWFVINGAWTAADACMGNGSSFGVNTCDIDPDFPSLLQNTRAGGLKLRRTSDNTVVDVVGWGDDDDVGPHIASYYEGTPVPDPSTTNGIGTGNQIVRVSSPGASLAELQTYGQAYDTDNNKLNWVNSDQLGSGIVVPPRNSAAAAKTVLTGRPAIGAKIAANDINSGGATASTAYITSGTLSLPYAPYSLQAVSTGTWTVIVATGSYYKQITNVVVTQNQTTPIPNAATTPAWSVANAYHLNVDSTTTDGFVTGQITNVTGAPISGITVNAGGVTSVTNANGIYFSQVSSGPITVVANPNNVNSAYVQGIALPTINSGLVTTQDFTLTQGGGLRGYITSGTTPLPGIQVTANIGGSQYGSATSDTSGAYTIRNLSTGTYRVQPVIDAGQDSAPNYIDVTVISTTTVTVGTFTVTGAFGKIIGTITYNGQSVTSGALILASTATIASTPPLIAASSSPAMTVMYAASSKADGTYEISTRGSSTYTYRLSAYVPVISGSGSVSITTKTWSGITVTPNNSTTFNLTIP